MPKFCDQCGAAIWGQFCGACGAEGPAAAVPPPPQPFGAVAPPPGVSPPPGAGIPPPGPVGRSRKFSPLMLTVTIIGAGLAAVVLVLVLAGGGSSSSDSSDSTASSNGHRYQYPTKVEDNFVRACTTSGGTDGECRCALGHLEDTVTFARFIEMDSEARTTGKVPQDALNALQGC